MKELLERGFDMNLQDSNGITPYELAKKANDDIKECFGIDIEKINEIHEISSQVSITTTKDDNHQLNTSRFLSAYSSSFRYWN